MKQRILNSIIFLTWAFLKKIAAILLLTVLLFNWFGYRLLISFIEHKADARLETELDKNNYDESQLLSIKVPATDLSYYVNSKLFERVDGQIEIKGVSYKYVKRRLYNDSVELMCILNKTAMSLHVAKNDLFRLVNDIEHKENKKGSADFFKNISTDFIITSQHLSLSNFYFTTSTWTHYVQDATSFYFSSVIENPPEKKLFLS
jgi:hypothetical protein